MVSIGLMGVGIHTRTERPATRGICRPGLAPGKLTFISVTSLAFLSNASIKAQVTSLRRPCQRCTVLNPYTVYSNKETRGIEM